MAHDSTERAQREARERCMHIWTEAQQDERRAMLEDAETRLGLGEAHANADWWPKGKSFADAWASDDFRALRDEVQGALIAGIKAQAH
jgi:hypothetical protein